MWSQDATQQRNTSLDEIDSDPDFDDEYADPDFEDDFSGLDLDDDDSETKDVSADDVAVSGIRSCKEYRNQNRCANYFKRNANYTREGKRS